MINNGLMLGQRRRQWANIKPALLEWLVFLVKCMCFEYNMFLHDLICTGSTWYEVRYQMMGEYDNIMILTQVEPAYLRLRLSIMIYIWA